MFKWADKLTSASGVSDRVSVSPASETPSFSTTSPASFVSSLGVALPGAGGVVATVELPSSPSSFSTDSFSPVPLSEPSESSASWVSGIEVWGGFTHQTLDVLTPYYMRLQDYPKPQAFRTVRSELGPKHAFVARTGLLKFPLQEGWFVIPPRDLLASRTLWSELVPRQGMAVLRSWSSERSTIHG
ncbi:hypothetical protein N431DRAFT_167981 [Stipitochalara longipes BDJ]|nr:hypothetical protein N431DRAFT_167981 [Stipitochalara longipes BDJ]